MRSFEFTKELNQSRLDYNLKELIEKAEDELSKLPGSDFHKIIGRDLLHLSQELERYIDDFFHLANRFYRTTISASTFLKFFDKNYEPEHLKAINCEMNKFTKSCDAWFVDLFSYSSCGDSDTLDWFDDFDFFTKNSLILSGFEDIQEVYKKHNTNSKEKNDRLVTASKVCEVLIILRLQEVLQHVLETNIVISKVPVFVTTYSNDLVLQSQRKNGQSLQKIVKNEKANKVLNPLKYSFFG